MPTGDQKKRFYDKVLLNKDALDSKFLRYLENLILKAAEVVYPSSVTFSGGILSADTANTFDVTAFDGVDGMGHRIIMPSQNNVNFPNVTSSNYDIAYRYIEIPVNVEVNQATATLEYALYEDQVGEVAAPTEVFDDGDGTLTIVVDSVYEASQSYSGRTCRVWMVNPKSLVTWFEDLTVAFGTHPTHFPATSKNYISTAGKLGQPGTPSTTAADYQVWAKGPTVRKDPTTIDSDRENYIYLGRILGNAGVPAVITDGRIIPISGGVVAPGELTENTNFVSPNGPGNFTTITGLSFTFVPDSVDSVFMFYAYATTSSGAGNDPRLRIRKTSGTPADLITQRCQGNVNPTGFQLVGRISGLAVSSHTVAFQIASDGSSNAHARGDLDLSRFFYIEYKKSA